MRNLNEILISGHLVLTLSLCTYTSMAEPTKQGLSSSISCQDFLTAKLIALTDLEQLQTEWRKIVGERLNQAIIRKNFNDGVKYTQTQLSRDSLVDASSIPKYIKGLHSLPLAHATRISHILNVELKWLLAQDLLIGFNVNGFKVLPEHFPGKNRMQALYDAFMATVWSKPDIENQTTHLISDIDPQLFCINDCSTEELVHELKRRGWSVNLNLLD